ncbi:MAG TPA: DinB family protein [Terracidiphilus sp.]|nr:DinB family protein [Terracidiphilus sp.]
MKHTIARIAGRALALCLLSSAAALASAQAAPAAKPAKPAVGTPQPPSQIYGKLLAGMEKEFVDLAEAMPEDKFNYAPTEGEFKGVRSFSGQVKHVAEANYFFFAGDSFTEAQDKAKSEAIEKLTSKADIIAALKDSFQLAHTLVDGTTADNAFVTTTHGTRAGMISFGLAHLNDHYGQMVVYLRSNGIIPPASRGGNM